MCCIVHGCRVRKSHGLPAGPKCMKEFFSEEAPAFLVGPANGVERGGLGPGAVFNTLDQGDDCAELSQLERRLYHPYAMPEARAERRRKATEMNSQEMNGKGAMTASASAPTLGQDMQKPRPRPLRPNANVASFVLMPVSDVASECSGWRRDFQRQAPPGLFDYGLMSHDISRATFTTPGVCVQKEMVCPRVQPVEASAIQARVDHATRSLERNIREDAEARLAFLRRPTSGGGSENGGSNEFLPRHQRLNVGKPSMCRPLPDNMLGSEKRHNNALADDSVTTTEHRGNFWWKGCTEERRKEIKAFVRPLDDYIVFRDTALKMKNTARENIPTTLLNPRTKGPVPKWSP